MTTEKVKAKVSHRFTAAPEPVYDAWLDPEKVRIWMSAALKDYGLPGEIKRVEVDARVGGTFLFSDMREAGEAKHWGTYLTLDRPRTIAFTWINDASHEADPSKVTITIEPDGDGCVATIVHEMGAEWASWIEKVEGGWSRMLRAIDALTHTATT
jgi:uncharacterized protein YndB with AHSA1/START domain